MLFKLSLQNMKKSVKDYAIYFFTLIFGVALFYIFNAIETQSAMLLISENTKDMIKLLVNIMSGLSVFIACVLGFLVIYANRFLMKRRNKEFGLYLLLGMGKRKVSAILFIETLLIGFISLGVGLLLGVALSQLTSVFVAGMFDAPMEKYQFVFSKDACLRTVAYFGIMYLVVVIFNTIIISRCKLIELLSKSRKNETVKMKNPWLCTLVFFIAAAILGYAYNRVVWHYEDITDAKQMLIYIGLGCLGTFLVFWSLSGLLFRIVSSVKSFYYKGLNSFVARQISSQINTNVFSMTIICLMLFVTICVLSNALGMRNSLQDNLRKFSPADVEIVKFVRAGKEGGDAWASIYTEYTKKQQETKDLSILEVYKETVGDVEKDFSEYVSFHVYATEEFTFADSFGDYLDTLKKEYPYGRFDNVEAVIKVSDYNKMAKIYNLETITLTGDEYVLMANYPEIVKWRNKALEINTVITLSGVKLTPKYSVCQDGFLDMASQEINIGFFVVPDEAVKEEAFEFKYEYLIANYAANSEDEILDMDKKLDSIKKYEDSYITPSVQTRTDIRESSIGLGAIVTFIGLYIGVVFLISGAAVLALKELSESADNAGRYQMLQKLGADRRMLHKALLGQMFLFFGGPVVLAMVHSIFGMMFSESVLKTMGTEITVGSILTTAVILLIIYGGYFIITYLCGKNIIEEG